MIFFFFLGELSTMWSLWGYGWLGLVCQLWEGFSRIRNLYNNFLLHIYVVQFFFFFLYICVLPVQFVYHWHFSFLTFDICLTLCKKRMKRRPKFDVFTYDCFETIIEYSLLLYSNYCFHIFWLNGSFLLWKLSQFLFGFDKYYV